jgi:NitT/TauT family transport system ATP-binding protein
MVSAQALARVVADRKARGREPLTFGMTFPFSTHNYHLRFWMAAGGVDPDEDVRMIVLPPPYMVESLPTSMSTASVSGAWNSVAVDLAWTHPAFRVGDPPARRGSSAVRAAGPTTIRMCSGDWCARMAAAAFVEDGNRDEVAAILSAPDRIAVAPEVIRRTLDGRLKVSPDGTYRTSDRYLLVGRAGAARPDPVQAAWLYAQMVRWGSAIFKEMVAAAKAAMVRRDAALPGEDIDMTGRADGIGVFNGWRSIRRRGELSRGLKSNADHANLCTA